MGKTNRKRYSAEFKAKVAREAMKEGATIVDIAARYGIHPNQVGEWKKQAIEGLAVVFSSKTSRIEAANEAQIKDLHAKIGQLTVEKDFLAKAFAR
jgi:transposase